ncbi:MAG: hypothetical protein AB7I50_18505 [Vicinamibacterales bacterium]
MDDRKTLDDIRRLYFGATNRSIQKDLARAIVLFKALRSEESREKAAVYMDGLSQMRSEWAPPSSTGGSRARTSRPGVKPRT